MATRLATVVIALALLGANAARASGPTLTVSEYRAKANAICASLNAYMPPNGTLASRFGALLAKAHTPLPLAGETPATEHPRIEAPAGHGPHLEGPRDV